MESFMNSIFYQVLSVISSIIIPIVGFLVSYFQIRDAHTEKKIRNFKIASEIMPEDRGEYAESCLELYRERYKAQIRSGEVVVRNLIYKRNWVQAAGNERFCNLNDVPVQITPIHWGKNPPRARFLPYPKEGFSANKKYELSGNTSKLFNGKLFALHEIQGDLNRGDLSVSVKNGGYFDFLDTCEYLVYEMSYARRVQRKKPPYRLGSLPAFSVLPNRSRYGDVFDMGNRFAGIGINTATILYNVEIPGDSGEPEKSAVLLLHHRSSQVAEGIGAIHVIPAGSYQPVGTQLDSVFNRNLANTVYREFGEELLNIDEFIHLNTEEMLEDKYCQWQVLLLGFGIEPLNTKIEVLTTLQVDMEQPENQRLFASCRTLAQLEKFFSTNYEGNLSLIPMNRKNLQQYQQDPRMTPAGKELLAILLEHEEYFSQANFASDKKTEAVSPKHRPCWNAWME
ncbi:MAG: hypothetical protein IJP07_06410 [Firmicutes bacterium]|nr:hypothetical protein [Bacillota bacterium]